MTEAYCMDCMEYMTSLPDKAFSLAIVDPPYGDALGGGWDRFGGWFQRYKVEQMWPAVRDVPGAGLGGVCLKVRQQDCRLGYCTTTGVFR